MTTTKLVLTASGDEAAQGQSLYVQNTFDEVMDKVMPISGPSSALEARENSTYTLTDGRRLMIHPGLIGWFIENEEEE